jgi:hypothetical protein
MLKDYSSHALWVAFQDARRRMKIGARQEKLTSRWWARDRIKRYVVQRFYTRFHMSLILLSSGFAALLGNWVLLHMAGVPDMWIRYPLAVGLSYLTFLAGVWLWLQYVGLGQGTRESESSLADGIDAPDIPLGGGGGGEALPEGLGKGGGQFGGGGASGSWGESGQVEAFVGDGGVLEGSGGGSSGSSFKLDDLGDLDGDGIGLLLLALALVAAIFLASGYIIWFAPDILSEAAFGAALAAGLAKSAKHHNSEGWVADVVKKTWWPFAIVLALAQSVAVYAAVNYPTASTLGQAISLALE